MDDERPILALDVDGVISLFGFNGPVTDVPGRFHLIDGMAHCIPEGINERLARLADDYDLVWATGWEDRANDRLPEILGPSRRAPFPDLRRQRTLRLGPLEDRGHRPLRG